MLHPNFRQGRWSIKRAPDPGDPVGSSSGLPDPRAPLPYAKKGMGTMPPPLAASGGGIYYYYHRRRPDSASGVANHEPYCRVDDIYGTLG